MREWGFWEWVAYGGIFIAALILAADTGFKAAPDLAVQMPNFTRASLWGFSPAILVVSATIILVMRELVFHRKASRKKSTPENPGNDAWADNMPLERVYNQKFKNEIVTLDGRHFINPIFDNVTFLYQGTAPVFLENPTYVLHGGKMYSRFTSRNKVIGMALKIQDNLLKASGVQTALIDFGPEATFAAPKLGQESFTLGTLGWVSSHERPEIENFSDVPLKQILRQLYKNQTVILDGFNYVNCIFDNVTLMYDGTKPAGFADVTFIGEIRLGSINPAVRTIIGIAEILHRATGGKSELVTVSQENIGTIRPDFINPPTASPASPTPPKSPEERPPQSTPR